MDTRTVTLLQSMTRIAAVVECHAPLRELAAESKAFELFKQEIARFEQLRQDAFTLPLERRELELRLIVLKKAIIAALQCITAVAKIIAPNVLPLPRFPLPTLDLHECHFQTRALGIVSVVQPHLDVFIQSGLHPRKLDDIRALVAELIDTHVAFCMKDVKVETLGSRTRAMVESARDHRDLLYEELKPLLKGDARAEWVRAKSLGRTHRPKALPVAEKPRYLPGRSAKETARQGVRSLARRVVLRIVGGDDSAAPSSHQPDVTIEEIRRLGPGD